MRRISTLVLVVILSSLAGCIESKTDETPLTPVSNSGRIEYYGETLLIDESDNIIYDGSGNPIFVLFKDIGFIGLAEKDALPIYQIVKLDQTIGGLTVTEGTSMGFDFIEEKWILTESDVRFTGLTEVIGELTKTPESEFQLLAPGTLTFAVTDPVSGIIPLRYEGDALPYFTLSGYDPETEFPELFKESDTINVKAVFNYLRILKTERATSMNYATLVNIEVLDKSNA